MIFYGPKRPWSNFPPFDETTILNCLLFPSQPVLVSSVSTFLNDAVLHFYVKTTRSNRRSLFVIRFLVTIIFCDLLGFAMASNLFKALTTSLNRPSNSRSLCLVSGQISNHTAKWMQVLSLQLVLSLSFLIAMIINNSIF